MAHVGDAGSNITQEITDATAAQLVGATIRLMVLRPDGSTATPITGSLDGTTAQATIPATLYPLPGVYTLEFDVEIDAANRWRLPRRYLLVDPVI